MWRLTPEPLGDADEDDDGEGVEEGEAVTGAAPTFT